MTVRKASEHSLNKQNPITQTESSAAGLMHMSKASEHSNTSVFYRLGDSALAQKMCLSAMSSEFLG